MEGCANIKKPGYAVSREKGERYLDGVDSGWKAIVPPSYHSLEQVPASPNAAITKCSKTAE